MVSKNPMEIKNHSEPRNPSGIPLVSSLRRIGLSLLRRRMGTKDHPEKERRLEILGHSRDKSDYFFIQNTKKQSILSL